MQRVDYKADTEECEIALRIDDSHKNVFYHFFFGWRRTFIIDNIEIMEFVLSEKEIKIIEFCTKRY